ncbi:MAG: hypothetical protein ACM3ZA_06775 [Bacillota bacterium]
MAAQRRVVILYQNGLFGAGLRRLLSAEPDIQVVGTVPVGPQMGAVVRGLAPDVVLVDRALDPKSLRDPAGQGHGSGPRVICLTLEENQMDVLDSQYRPCPNVDDLLEAIRSAVSAVPSPEAVTHSHD